MAISDYSVNQKRTQFIDVAKTAFLVSQLRTSASNSDIDGAAAEVVNHFARVTAPEDRLDDKLEIIIVNRSGLGGGRSIKPGNVFLDIRKLMEAASAGVLTAVAAIGYPWTAPFAALLIWREVRSVMTIEIAERDAVVFWVLWQNRDLNNQTVAGDLLANVNRELSANGRPPITEQSMQESLRTLEAIRCIERTASLKDSWFLPKWVSVPYR